MKSLVEAAFEVIAMIKSEDEDFMDSLNRAMTKDGKKREKALLKLTEHVFLKNLVLRKYSEEDDDKLPLLGVIRRSDKSKVFAVITPKAEAEAGAERKNVSAKFYKGADRQGGSVWGSKTLKKKHVKVIVLSEA